MWFWLNNTNIKIYFFISKKNLQVDLIMSTIYIYIESNFYAKVKNLTDSKNSKQV